MPDLDDVLRQLSAGRARLENISGAVTVPERDNLMAEIAQLTHELLVADEELRAQDDELQLARTRLRGAAERWERAFAAAPVPYLVTDANGIVVNTNRAARELLGEPPGATRVRPVASKFAESERSAVRTLTRQAAAGGAELQTKARRSDGVERAVRVTVVPLELDDERDTLLWWQLLPVDQHSAEESAVIAALAVALTRVSDAGELARRATESLCALVPGVAWALLYCRPTPTAPAVDLLAGAGELPDLDPPARVETTAGDSALVRALRTGTPVGAALPVPAQATTGQPAVAQVVAVPFVDDRPPADVDADSDSDDGAGPGAAGARACVVDGALLIGLAGDADRDTVALLHAAAGIVGTQLRMARRLTAERDRVANLTVALDTNRRIGAALGILMARHKITDEQAFDLLRSASQHRHVKLRDLAEEVLLTGELGWTPEPSSRRARPATAGPVPVPPPAQSVD